MRLNSAGFIVGALLLLPGIGLCLGPREVFKAADPSIVVIFVTDKANKDQALGSGVIVGPTDVVTSCHVVENSANITVKQGGITRKARLRFQDSGRDLCQIQLDDSFPSGKPVSAFVMSKDLEVGQAVYAIGSPQGLEHTLSLGIVSALRAMKDNRGYLIQTDAAVSPGSSGGGLFDEEAKLVGLITFQFKEGQNLNFAIPADWIQELAIRNRDRIAGAPTPPPTVAAIGEGGSTQPFASIAKPGDKWRYRILHESRAVGLVSIEVLETDGTRVKERITKEANTAFVHERVVDASGFDPKRFLPQVELPGGYQLSEFAPYFPEGIELHSGMTWTDVAGDFKFQRIGKHRLLASLKVIGEESIRVPAGTYQTWKIVANVSEARSGQWYERLTGTYWYSPASRRIVKMHFNSKSARDVDSSSETYELAGVEMQ
jgi:hypothetical protein